MPKPTSLLKGFEKTVETARPDPNKRRVIFDETTTGLALIISPKGKKTFTLVARNPLGKQVWKELGQAGQMTVAAARAKAALGIARIKAGEAEPFPEEKPQLQPDTFQAVAERFIQRWVDRGGKNQDGVPLRSKRAIQRHFSTYLYPRWATQPFTSIRRGAVTQMLDELVDNHGAVQADRVLATLAKLFNWYRQYDENYVSPVIPEMKRAGSHIARARHRVLDDGEIRTLWAACDKVGAVGAFVRLALLTAQRKGKVSQMRWEDIREGVWHIPVEEREKANAGVLKLPKLALEVINAQPQIEGNPFVIAGRGGKPLNSFSDGKEDLATVAPIAPWVFHDLRRTARSLMARAGVRPDIAERTLGHVLAGVEATYNRHAYLEEKGAALEALAALVERILQGDDAKVVPIRSAQT